MKLAVVGNSGSGKSTLAARLAERHGLAHLDLDTIAFEPGQVAVPRDRAVAEADVVRFCSAHDAWVIEGCYAGLIEAALRFRPTLLFLDPGTEACVAHCRARPWEPHKYASKAEQDEKLTFLIEWVRGYDTREGELSRTAHEALYAGYEGPRERLRTMPGARYRPPAG